MSMHVPVLKNEVLEYLRVEPEQMYLDGTFGRGGHTREILARGGRVVAFDQDADAITAGGELFSSELASEQLTLIHSNFANLTPELKVRSVETQSFAGALFDLGMSSDQIEVSGRGFSFLRDEPLDMRMNENLGVTAADLLNALPEKHLKALFWENAQETFASAIARAVVKRREKQPWRSTKELADLIWQLKRGRQDGKLHPATKVFQALRIAVNMELDNLTILLDQILPWLKSGARLEMISFHEGEDRLVKQTFRQWERLGKGLQVTEKPVGPSEEELQSNPRSRSAKLRVLELI